MILHKKSRQGLIGDAGIQFDEAPAVGIINIDSDQRVSVTRPGARIPTEAVSRNIHKRAASSLVIYGNNRIRIQLTAEPTMTWPCEEGCSEQCESGLYTYMVEDTGVPFIHYLKVNIPGCDGSTEGDVAISYIPSFYVENNGDSTFNVPPNDPEEAHYHIHQVM